MNKGDNLMLKYLMYSIFLLSPIMSQTDPDTSSSDDGGEEQKYAMNTSVYVDFSKNTGNTTAEILYYGLSFGLFGDYGPLKDTEFSFSYSANDAVVSGEQWEDDANLILKFDLWASQRFSPFLFLQNEKDAIVGLNNRLNYGMGGKVNLLFGTSISYALLAESENYTIYESTIESIDSVESEYYYYTWDYDTTYGYSEADSIRDFARHSIRPKIKLKLLDGNVVFDYRFYYKPNVEDFDDYLLQNELTVNIATFYEAMSIYLTYSDSYNSRYDKPDAQFKPKDSSLSIGFQFDL
tara:strand:- start:1777 stop:2658 length:882 start_codon:yes stop_codon:yes gene_type:complete